MIMNPRDKNYLRLQFWDRIFRKNGTEFQTFFEEIMQKAFPEFTKIKPHGRSGDAGNDGYIPSKGIYYQVYSPEKPNETEAKAIKKLEEDFEKIKSEWPQISEVKEYYFVYNDKDAGSTVGLEKSVAGLKERNPGIECGLFVPRNLEEIFFSLKQEDILYLGFDIDATKALSMVYDYLEQLDSYLDRDNGEDAMKALNIIETIIQGLSDEDLSLRYELQKARALQKLERIEEAKDIYESLCIRYPKDPMAFLYLAEYYLGLEDYQQNEELLKKAALVNKEHWLYSLEILIRDNRLGNQIAESEVDEKTFPDNPKIKSSFYRIYSHFFLMSGNVDKAYSYIERAIQLNPDRANNYDMKLAILRYRAFSQDDEEQLITNVKGFLADVETIENKMREWGEISPRNQCLLNYHKIFAFRFLQSASEIENLAPKTFELLMECHFDYLIDRLFSELLALIELPVSDFNKLQQHFNKAEKALSDELSKSLVIQFNFKKELTSKGKAFFETIKKVQFVEFIDALENNKWEDVWNFLKQDTRFAIGMANTAKEFPDLRKKIINNLPDDEQIQREKLLLLLSYDESKADEAFEILKGLDLSKLTYFECKLCFEIAHKKGAWEFVIKIIEKLLEYEKDKRIIVELKLQLYSANMNLGKLIEAIQIGEQLLSNNDEIRLLSEVDKEALLGQTLIARLKRGEYPEAKMLLEKHTSFSTSFEFKTTVEPEVYLTNNDAQKALNSIVEGVKIIRNPSPEQYGRFFMIFVEIGNRIDFTLSSLETVEPESFVKLSGQQRWYYVGNDEELDATKIPPGDSKYSVLLDKKLGDKVSFEYKYRSDTTEYTIENILPIEKYILWQCRHHAEELSKQQRWDVMEIIDVPRTGDTIDPKYIIARFQDEREKREDFFKLYCEGNAPLAFLAVNEGGLVNALSYMCNENKGFVRFSSGNIDELNQQMELAKRVIAGEPFYLDGTSAFVLSESGFLEKIYEYLPTLRIPQSVINLLLEIKDRFKSGPGRAGYLGYAQGQLRISDIKESEAEQLQSKLEKHIKLLESNSQNIEAISNAIKVDCFTEQRVPPELCDACILAQRDNSVVLTEDFFYLKANELETKKKAPEYFSSFALFRVLYEQGKINFDEYLDMFSYLGSYRFRFLPLSIVEIEKAVYGDGIIKNVRPEKIQNLRFQLTLSEEYGVPFDKSFSLVARYLVNMLVDDTILPEVAQKIFIEIMTTFPTNKDKITIGEMFLQISARAINRMQKKLIVGIRTQEKINLLRQSINIYGPKESLWKP